MTKGMNLSKEQLASRKIMTLIQKDDYPIGARLPSERLLAEIVDASRNTLRSAMRQLQALGVVEIRSGSGSYILRKEIPPLFSFGAAATPVRQTIADLMEARYLIEPAVAAQAAAQASGADVEKLEARLTAIGRASINKRYDLLMEEERFFRKRLALSTGNPQLAAIEEHLTLGCPEWASLHSSLSENDKATLFADYVDIFNAVKNKQPDQAHLVLQRHVLRLCRFLSEYQNMALSATIVKALDRSVTEPNDEGSGLSRRS
jgi:GntR family transcriptional repressor for pyruvate dehydrogenase complex